ncbi:ABC transporter [Planosporangium thailandense]|uniref:ABC transporter n=2 Tax=Planosporangium thailandense TaxID=765197 RepID=A0ABX0XS94_9ACTN|nr:ABC transporter [Planosporangium thailandense]
MILETLRGSDPMKASPPSDVPERVNALRRLLRAVDGHLPEQRLAAARTVVDHAGERLRLSGEHCVVALAGATGSGKSSLFNALTRLQLSPVGVRRPTTGVAHACVWGPDNSGELLDWLGVPPSRRFRRESALDGDDERTLRGLILLDLPDFDSVEQSHRVEVDRLLSLVDLVVWVLDPQKYADRVVHTQYLAQFSEHRDVTVVVLNQADRLQPADVTRCVDDLKRLLVADGLDGVPVFATSAVERPGALPLRELLESTVAKRQAALLRIGGDVDGVVADLAPLFEPEAAEHTVDRETVETLTGALAAAGGVPVVADAARRAYTHRAVGAVGWPVSRWLRRLRPDPLRRLRLGDAKESDEKEPIAATSVPPAAPAERAAVGLALRALGERAGAGLPDPWPAVILAAARSRADDLPDALDTAIARADLGMDRRPLWWRLVGGLQWLVALAALVGLLWLAVRYVFFALGLPELPGPHVGRVPLATVLLVGGLVAGLLVSIVARPLIRFGARRAQARVQNRLRTAVKEVARDLVVAPVREVLHAYADARSALHTASGR